MLVLHLFHGGVRPASIELGSLDRILSLFLLHTRLMAWKSSPQRDMGQLPPRTIAILIPNLRV